MKQNEGHDIPPPLHWTFQLIVSIELLKYSHVIKIIVHVIKMMSHSCRSDFLGKTKKNVGRLFMKLFSILWWFTMNK